MRLFWSILLINLVGCGNEQSSSLSRETSIYYYGSSMTDANNGVLEKVILYASGTVEWIEVDYQNSALNSFTQHCGTYSMDADQLTISINNATNTVNADAFFVNSGAQSIQVTKTNSGDLINSLQLTGYSQCP